MSNTNKNLPARLPQLDPEIIPALSETTIRTLTLNLESKKIRDFKEKDFKRLAEKMYKWQRFLGVTNIIDENEEEEILHWLRDYYADLSIEEIDKAIKLAAAHELKLDNAEHYNQFGAMYLGRVLPAYKRFRAAATSKYNQLLRERDKDRPKEYTNGQIVRISINAAAALYEEFLRSGRANDIGNATYKFFYSRGYFVPTQEQYQDAETRARQDLISEHSQLEPDPNQRSKNKAIVQALIDMTEQSIPPLEAETKRLLLAQYFGRLKADSIDLLDLLEKNLEAELKDVRTYQRPMQIIKKEKGAKDEK